jgi:hypothetical protein
MNETELANKIEQLSRPAVAEAVKNLQLAMQFHWKHEVTDEQARQILESTKTSGEADELRRTILAADPQLQEPQEMERWGKSLLLYVASDPDMFPLVDQAVEDALRSSSKDFGLSALIILGVVVVLLKWRPASVQAGKSGVTIKWKENDVSIVKDLAKSVASMMPGTGQTTS